MDDPICPHCGHRESKHERREDPRYPGWFYKFHPLPERLVWTGDGWRAGEADA